MIKVFRRITVLSTLGLLTACADGEPPLKNSTLFTTQFYSHSAILLESDPTQLQAFGLNTSGQLGNGATSNQQTSPVLVKLPASVPINAGPVSIGGSHTLVVGTDNNVYAWGSNTTGQLGDAAGTTPRTSPGRVTDLTNNISEVAAGGSHSLALQKVGTVTTVWAWGSNSSGQLGVALTTTDTHKPRAVADLGITTSKIAAGGAHSLALDSTGTVRAWGDNSHKQLGSAVPAAPHMPVVVDGVSGITRIAAGGSHNLALKDDGTVWAWGGNRFGQLGNNSVDDKGVSTPVPVIFPGKPPEVKATAIAAGTTHSLARMDDGTVWAWGHNLAGQLGIGSTVDSHIPVKVSINNVAVKDVMELVVVGGHHTIVRKMSDGKFLAWGYNEYGQLGDGTTTNRHEPVAITLQ